MKRIPFRFRWKEEMLIGLLGGVCAVSLFYNILLFNRNARLQRTYDHLYHTFCEICTTQQAALNGELQLSQQGKPWEKTGKEGEELFNEQR